MAQFTLEQLKAYRLPTKLHPIAGLTVELYTAAGSKLTPEGLDQIRGELQATSRDLKELTDALAGLAAIIMYATEKLNDPLAADQIAGLIKEMRPHYEEVGNTIAAAYVEAAEKTSNAFNRLTGREEEKKAAPKYGEAGPEGSIPVAKLVKPVAKPPVPVKAPKKKQKR